MKSQRIDLVLVEKKLASSRTKAQDLIRAGHVFLDGKKVESVSHPYITGELSISESELNKFVSRGGLKLEGALKHIELNVKDFTCLDIGVSTGGFADCLLQYGAQKVVGIDVGQNQLADSLKSNLSLLAVEKLNAKLLSQDSRFIELVPQDLFNLCVIDVSFISLVHVLPQAVQFSQSILALVKPQFELNADALDKNGIVKDESNYALVETKIKDCLLKLNWKVESFFPSQLAGKDGNREFFVYAHK
jgi:23S rRNA (cytidine1920-2'-O)/16S rRNA (cytidine1409-2'-O)-methyltransferase